MSDSDRFPLRWRDKENPENPRGLVFYYTGLIFTPFIYFLFWDFGVKLKFSLGKSPIRAKSLRLDESLFFTDCTFPQGILKVDTEIIVSIISANVENQSRAIKDLAP